MDSTVVIEPAYNAPVSYTHLVLSPEFKEAGHPVYLFAPANSGAQSQREAWETFHQLCRAGRVCSAWAVEHGIAEGIMQMSFGNSIGFQADGREIAWDLPCPGAIVAELTEDTDLLCAVRLGTTTAEPVPVSYTHLMEQAEWVLLPQAAEQLAAHIATEKEEHL